MRSVGQNMNQDIALVAREVAATPRRPRLSVLLPLGDARLDAVDNVAAWTEGQSCDSRDFEIIAVGDGNDPDMEMAVAKILRPHDKFITSPPTEHVLARLARAAKHADADILLFAEHHCLPDSRCVDATIRFFDQRPDAAIGMFAERHRLAAARGELNQQWFTEMEALGLRAQTRKLQTGTLTMRRDRYLALGGHDGRYGLFADEILTAATRREGLTGDRIAGTVMTHITATMSEHRRHVEDFTRGECAFLAANDPAFCEKYFGHVHVWANRGGLDPDLARTTATMIGRVLLSDLCAARDKAAFQDIANLSRELGRHLLPATFGPRASLAFARARMRWSELRCLLSRDPARRWDHYHRAWQRMIDCTRLSCAMDHSDIPATVPATPDVWSIVDIPEAQRIGFYGLEDWQGAPFRWSEPVMMIRIARPPGRVRVAVDMLPARSDASRHIRTVFWGGRRVTDIAIDDGRIRFPIDIVSSQPQWLSIIATPLVAPDDSRRLGIPVRALSFTPE